ncbi:hypothetical protein DFJ74DRAFT_318773 [Hyaloraphidium curvatum]|nr:hypothetical protein DFJ74DRAFT_318773 [Hyaloraphidium curvatum]
MQRLLVLSCGPFCYSVVTPTVLVANRRSRLPVDAMLRQLSPLFHPSPHSPCHDPRREQEYGPRLRTPSRPGSAAPVHRRAAGKRAVLAPRPRRGSDLPGATNPTDACERDCSERSAEIRVEAGAPGRVVDVTGRRARGVWTTPAEAGLSARHRTDAVCRPCRPAWCCALPDERLCFGGGYFGPRAAWAARCGSIRAQSPMGISASHSAKSHWRALVALGVGDGGMAGRRRRRWSEAATSAPDGVAVRR